MIVFYKAIQAAVLLSILPEGHANRNNKGAAFCLFEPDSQNFLGLDEPAAYLVGPAMLNLRVVSGFQRFQSSV